MEENPDVPVEAIQCSAGLSSKTYSDIREEAPTPRLCVSKVSF